MALCPQQVLKSPERGHLSPVSSPPRSPRSVIERQGLERSTSSSNAEAAGALEPGLTRPPGSATDAGRRQMHTNQCVRRSIFEGTSHRNGNRHGAMVACCVSEVEHLGMKFFLL